MWLRKLIREALNQYDWIYEFHLSTEPNLKEGLPFSKQIRTSSISGERGDMGTNDNGMIFTTDSPEQWYDQFQMELGSDVPEAIPNYLYIVKVKNPSKGTYLSQAINKPEDVIIVKQVPDTNGEPNFKLGYQIKQKLETKLL